MSNKKKNQSISEEIHNILKPKDIYDDDDHEEDVPRFEEFDEHFEIDNKLSAIRKQNVKQLNELDSKYKGKVVSRKEMEQEENSEGSSDEDGSDSEQENGVNNDYATDSDEEEAKEDGSSDKQEMDSDQEMDSNEDDEDQDDEDDEDNEDDDEDDDNDEFDLSQFTKNKSENGHNTSVKDSTKLIKNTSANEEVQKGISVQNQLKVWEKLLEVRIKSQKMLITANSLPDFKETVNVSSNDDGQFKEKMTDAVDGLYGLLDNLLDLQTTLVNKFPETKEMLKTTKRKKEGQESKKSMKKSKLVQYSDQIEDNYNTYTVYRNQVIQKWHDRTKSVKDSKNPGGNLNIVAKIENSLLNKGEMIRKTQIYRGDYEICGVENPKNSNEVKEDDTVTKELVLPEIFDDSEFYHQLLRELIEYKTNTGDNQTEITKKFIELQRVRSKMKKKVDQRASKGRKIRYVVHNKLISFMPPELNSAWTEDAKSELYSSLFGRTIVVE